MICNIHVCILPDIWMLGRKSKLAIRLFLFTNLEPVANSSKSCSSDIASPEKKDSKHQMINKKLPNFMSISFPQ